MLILKKKSVRNFIVTMYLHDGFYCVNLTDSNEVYKTRKFEELEDAKSLFESSSKLIKEA